MTLKTTTILLAGILLAFRAHALADVSAATEAPSPQSAQLTVEQLTQRVLSGNADLRLAVQAIDGARAAAVTASALPNPRLDWHSGSQRPIPMGPSGSTTQVTLTQPLENPWLRQARREAAAAGIDISRQQRELVRNDLTARVRVLALELQLRDEEVRVHTESLSLLEQVRERVRRRVETGEAARYDLIKAEAEIVGARQRLQQAGLMRDQVRLALNRLAGGTLPGQWALSGTLPDTTEMTFALVPGEAPLGRNPELRLLQEATRRAEATVRQAQASVLPAVDVVVTRGREPDMRQQAVGLGVSVPLFDRRQGPIAEARVDRIRAQTALEGRRAELEQEWLMARKSLEMAQVRIRSLSQGALREAEAAVRVAEAAWRFGERGILDVLDAQRVLRSLRADLIQARFEAQAAQIEIDRLQGRAVGSEG